MQKFDHNIGFWEKRHFFAENCQKSQKFVIITSTPGCWHICSPPVLRLLPLTATINILDTQTFRLKLVRHCISFRHLHTYEAVQRCQNLPTQWHQCSDTSFISWQGLGNKWIAMYMRHKGGTSGTRRFVKKCARLCWNIAQNGALVNKNFFPKKFMVKICEFLDKK
jgi:hypothetical protein